MSRARDFADLAAAYSGSAQLSNRNLLHNGDMTISQRGTSATGVGASNGVALLDRWNWSQSSNGRVTMTQEAVTDLSGFFHCLKVATTTADTSIAAGEYVLLSQGIESRGGLTQRMKKGYSDAERGAANKGRVDMRVIITSPPPRWATHYQLVYAGNSNVRDVVQYTTGLAFLENLDPQFDETVDNDSAIIYVSLGYLQGTNNISYSHSYGAMHHTGSDDLYTYSQGDNFLSTMEGAVYRLKQ